MVSFYPEQKSSGNGKFIRSSFFITFAFADQCAKSSCHDVENCNCRFLKIPKKISTPSCSLFCRSIARPDDPSKDNFLEDLVGRSSDACQMGSVLHTKLQSVIQVLVMVGTRVLMVSIRVIVPKVKEKRKRRKLVTQEGLLDSLLPHLVQQKGMFKVSSKFYDRNFQSINC